MSTTEYLDVHEDPQKSEFTEAFGPSVVKEEDEALGVATAENTGEAVAESDPAEPDGPPASKEGDHKHFKAPKPIPRGFSARARRDEEALAIFRQNVRRDNPRFDAKQVEIAAQEMFADFCADADPETWKQFMKLRPVSVAPDRKEMIDLAEVAAVRRLPEIQEIERLFARVSDGSGRPPGDALPIAAIEYMAFNKQIPRIRDAWQRFNGSDLGLDYAYGHRRAEKAQETEAGLTAAIHRILGENDPLFAMVQNIRLVKRLHEISPDGGKDVIGRYLTIDGTAIEANVLQKQTYSNEHFDIVNRNYKSRDGRRISAIFTKHDDKKRWRGYTLLVIVDQKTTLPLAWSLVTGDNKGLWENHIKFMLDVVFEIWPDCPAKYMTGDREFDVKEIYRRLYLDYSMHNVPQTLDTFSKMNDGEKMKVGTPLCTRKDCPRHKQPMSIESRDEWMTPEKRSKMEIPRGVTIPWSGERVRWLCDAKGCSFTVTTRPFDPEHRDEIRAKGGDPHEIKGSPHRVTFMPQFTSSKFSAIRKAIIARRNSSECLFSIFKTKGKGGRGAMKARWINSDLEMLWMVSLPLLYMTASRVAYAEGLYAEEHTNMRATKVNGIPLVKDALGKNFTNESSWVAIPKK